MARPALDRMPIDAVDISARRQQFVPIAILTLGNAGTATDGFDAMFAEAAQHVVEDGGFAENLTPDLRDADFIPGQIAEAALGPTAKDYEAFSGTSVSVLGTVTPSTGPGSSAPVNPAVQAVRDRIAEGVPPTRNPSVVGRAMFLDPYNPGTVGGDTSPI